MIEKNKGLVFGLFAFLLAIVSGFVLSGCSADKGDNIAYIDNVADFNLQFQTEKVIYVDDLDFGTNTFLNVNRSIKFVGKNEKSTIKNVYINITAPYIAEDKIKIEFENIIFDGGFDKTAYNLTQNGTFASILGNRDNKNWIEASFGYYDLNINKCEFTNYASEYGSVIHVDENANAGDKAININSSKFYGNVCKRGTISIVHKRASTKLTNCEFYENSGAVGNGFNICNGKLMADNCVIKDNNYYKLGNDETDEQEASGGGIHLGGLNGKMSNTKILNNESVFGGGLSIASKSSGDSSLIIENCEIKGNTAQENGGGVSIQSKSGQTVSFIGCEISFNKAKSSANIWSIPMSGWSLNNKSGNVNFFFCKIAMNEGMDNKGITTDLDFYLDDIHPAQFAYFGVTDNTCQNANTQVKGCIIIDDTTLTANEGDYNYMASQTQAEEDGVIDLAKITNSTEKKFELLKSKKINILVPASEYSKWNMEFVGATKSAKIGGTLQEDRQSNSALMIALISVAVLLCAGAGFVVYTKRNKSKLIQIIDSASALESVEVENKQETCEELSEQCDKREGSENCACACFNMLEIEQIISNWELVKTLSKKEKEVFVLRLSGKKRKEIAKKQYVSENTIKKQLIKIYTKLEVVNGKELIESAKKYLNN